MPREIVESTHDDDGWERHPAWGMIGASRVTGQATLFDSEIQHHHFVTVRIETAARQRNLNRDWIHGEKQIIEVAMSEAQWAAFVSSMNGRSSSCTIEYRESEGMVPGMPFEPRLQESMDEVRNAADEAIAAVAKAFAAYEEKKNAANLRTLKYTIANMPSNMTFAAKSLTEHTENVVQKARVDIEAMVTARAGQLGLEPGDLGLAHPQLPPTTEGESGQ